ncbi:hypothetical protein BD324DRAFT_614835 [Kockovaella imperatae]|uniref:Uncharacterized protein n=1 Tax=Kockovaella imperatae TaxID=4999 RepID=A0A1Y1UQG8_9TREE|nr:hypothetical protein BD324DRAFT_614835 [Kockovaella imperatae]ORX39744.1 hypothetical protein BD324DRAFT_614835 [Kockovaella imperatae]
MVQQHMLGRMICQTNQMFRINMDAAGHRDFRKRFGRLLKLVRSSPSEAFHYVPQESISFSPPHAVWCREAPDRRHDRTMEIWSDASMRGLGGHLGRAPKPEATWHQADPHPQDISAREAKAQLISLETWRQALSDCRVICYTDNSHVARALYRGKSMFPVTQGIIDQIKDLALSANMTIVPRLIAGKTNELADRLSRKQSYDLTILSDQALAATGGSSRIDKRALKSL